MLWDKIKKKKGFAVNFPSESDLYEIVYPSPADFVSSCGGTLFN